MACVRSSNSSSFSEAMFCSLGLSKHSDGAYGQKEGQSGKEGKC